MTENIFAFYDKILSLDGFLDLQINCSYQTESEGKNNTYVMVELLEEASELNAKKVEQLVNNRIGDGKTEEVQILTFKRLCAELDYYIEQITQRFKSEFPFFGKDLENVKVSLLFKNKYLFPTNEKEHITNKTQSITNQTITLNWNAGVASLATLFYDLMYDYKLPTGKSYLSDNADVIIPFIYAHFRDDKGEPFDIDTLKKYINKNSNGERVKEVKKNRVIVKKPSAKK